MYFIIPYTMVLEGEHTLNLKLKEKIRESLSAVLPITGIVLMISIFLIPRELGTIVSSLPVQLC